jgi:hypothetical protein
MAGSSPNHSIFPTSYQLAHEVSTRNFVVGIADHQTEAKAWCQRMLDAEHSLGAGKPVGKQLWQVIQRPGDHAAVAVIVWAASSLHLKERDRWIGWDKKLCASRLNLIVGNSRLLILEEHREPNLASQALSAAMRVLRQQWLAVYGYEPLIAEGFTDIETHHGTTYKVTNWTPLGHTQGFARHQASVYVPNERPKKLWCKELCKGARHILCQPELPTELRCAQIIPPYHPSQLKVSQRDSLLDVFRQVPDPRRSSHSYKISSTLCAVTMAMLAGQQNFNAIMRFIKALPQQQRKALGFPLAKNGSGYKVPVYNTVATMLKALDLAHVSELFAQWEQAHQGSLPRSLSLDGKSLGKGLGHLISMVISDGDAAGIPMAQATVDAGHEQAAVLKILRDPAVQIEGFTVTADALHCQEKQMCEVVNRGADFVFSLKNNQPTAFAYAQQQLATEPPLFAAAERSVEG